MISGGAQIRKGVPTKNPKINKRWGLLFGTGEYQHKWVCLLTLSLPVTQCEGDKQYQHTFEQKYLENNNNKL